MMGVVSSPSGLESADPGLTKRWLPDLRCSSREQLTTDYPSNDPDPAEG
jgi:hypothetical protein